MSVSEVLYPPNSLSRYASLAALALSFWGQAPVYATAARPLAELQSACDKGDHVACNNLGLRYVKGDAAPKNLVKAASIFKKSCTAEKMTACVNLGILYATGQGLSRNLIRASELFGEACDQGQARGCRLRGELLYHGKGLPQDRKTAAALFSMACGLGDMMACRAAAIQWDSGDGVKKDKRKANLFFRQACDGGVSSACDSLRRRRKALIWEIKGPSPSYLIPLIVRNFAIWDLPEKTRQALDRCPIVVTLADFSDVNRKDLEHTPKLRRGLTLNKLVGNEVMEGLEKELGISRSKLNSIHPGALIDAILLTRNPNTFGLMHQVSQRALRKGRKPIYLTTPTEITRRMTEASIQAYAALLTELILRRPRYEKAQTDTMLAFQQGDEQLLKRQVFSPQYMQLAGALVDPMVRAPEGEWVGILRPLLKKGGICVALPAPHFLGKHNLRQKLNERGFPSERVSKTL